MWTSYSQSSALRLKGRGWVVIAVATCAHTPWSATGNHDAPEPYGSCARAFRCARAIRGLRKWAPPTDHLSRPARAAQPSNRFKPPSSGSLATAPAVIPTSTRARVWSSLVLTSSNDSWRRPPSTARVGCVFRPAHPSRRCSCANWSMPNHLAESACRVEASCRKPNRRASANALPDWTRTLAKCVADPSAYLWRRPRSIAAVCGVVCPEGSPCQAGRCLCPSGSLACGETCIDASTDPANCGGCGRTCGPGSTCQSGECSCAAGLTVCDAGCVDLQADATHCGGCGQTCSGETVCLAGQCGDDCGALTQCGSACIDVSTSLLNCGSCGAACASGLSSIDGMCSCPSSSERLCGGVCVDTQADARNCGECGKVCSVGEICVAGQCACSSSTGVSFASDIEPILVAKLHGKWLPFGPSATGESAAHRGSSLC